MHLLWSTFVFNSGYGLYGIKFFPCIQLLQQFFISSLTLEAPLFHAEIILSKKDIKFYI
jgi:hypothetical protein